MLLLPLVVRDHAILLRRHTPQTLGSVGSCACFACFIRARSGNGVAYGAYSNRPVAIISQLNNPIDNALSTDATFHEPALRASVISPNRLARICAKAADLNCPRFGFPTSVRKFFRLIFAEAPFVKVVVTGDQIFRSQFHAIELERWIKRIRKSARRSARRHGQESSGREPEAKDAQEFSSAQIKRLWRYCIVRQIPGTPRLSISH